MLYSISMPLLSEQLSSRNFKLRLIVNLVYLKVSKLEVICALHCVQDERHVLRGNGLSPDSEIAHQAFSPLTRLSSSSRLRDLFAGIAMSHSEYGNLIQPMKSSHAKRTTCPFAS